MSNHHYGRFTNSESSRLNAWQRLAAHPFFKECFASEDTLVDAMIEKLDKVHSYLVEVDKYDENQETPA